jgi:hypothetical protein
MSNLPNLISPTDEDMRRFVTAIVAIAIRDHNAGAPRKNGKQIVALTASSARILHNRMATGIYNNTRWTMEVSGT